MNAFPVVRAGYGLLLVSAPAPVVRSRRRAAPIDGVGAGCFALARALLARCTPPAPIHSIGDSTPARLAAWREALAAPLAPWLLPHALRPPG